MIDRDRWGLRGQVRSCRLQRTWFSRRCGADLCETEERGDTTIVEFRPDGSLARRWQHNPDGSEWTSMYEYNGAGQLETVRTENGASQFDVQRYELRLCRAPGAPCRPDPGWTRSYCRRVRVRRDGPEEEDALRRLGRPATEHHVLLGGR